MTELEREFGLKIIKKRVKNFNFRVRANEAVLSVPVRASAQNVREVLMQKAAWLRAARQKAALAQSQKAAKNAKNSAGLLLLWGRWISVHEAADFAASSRFAVLAQLQADVAAARLCEGALQGFCERLEGFRARLEGAKVLDFQGFVSANYRQIAQQLRAEQGAHEPASGQICDEQVCGQISDEPASAHDEPASWQSGEEKLPVTTLPPPGGTRPFTDHFSSSEISSIEISLAEISSAEKLPVTTLPPHGGFDAAAVRAYEAALRRAELALVGGIYCECWSEILGVQMRSFRISRAAKRWGSCTKARGAIRLSAELAQHPPAAASYVALHECAHLLEANHSARFWAHVQRLMPDFRARRASLAERYDGQNEGQIDEQIEGQN